MSDLRAAYESVLYPSFPRQATTPDRLAAVATLFGMDPPDPETARVLEIGCSDGGNLIPIALTTPRGSFLGIDLAEPAIALGIARIAELGLRNISLQRMDLTSFPANSGSFDFIIVHGVLSWVPPEIRTAILKLVERHLSPNGVAYIDYTAQPGGQLRYTFRGAMRYHAQRFKEPQRQIDQARSLLRLIIEANPRDSLYRSLAEEELARLSHTPDAALFHDDLSDYNEPLYFHDFITAASEHGLQFLGESDLAEMNDARLPEPVRKKLTGLRNLIEKEQYFDILTNRNFRQTLLCRASCKINRTLDGSTLETLWFSSTAEEAPGEQVDQRVFRARLATVATTIPLVQAVLRTFVRQHPRRLTLAELKAELLRTDMHLADDLDAQLRSTVLRCIMSDMIEMHARAAPFAAGVTEHPAVSPLARLQILKTERVSTLGHRSTTLTDELTKRLLPLTDGTRTVAELARELESEESLISEKLRVLAGEELLLPVSSRGSLS